MRFYGTNFLLSNFQKFYINNKASLLFEYENFWKLIVISK